MKIACMTGSRADYPRVESVLREIDARMELKLIVTGMHLLKKFGYTVKEIEFDIAAYVEMYDDDDSPYGMAKAAARCCGGMADALEEIKPDLLLLTSDRVETLATATAAALMNIPTAHIQGGEVSGTIDESIRHAVTKLAHIHFPATGTAARRIIKMGEDPKNVYPVGCPYLDTIRTMEYKSKEELAFTYGFDPTLPLVIFIQHPVTTEYDRVAEQMGISIEALKRLRRVEIIAIYPNVDAGGRKIVLTLKDKFRLFQNINHVDFLSLLKHADVMVGNSSAGIREAPSFNLPVVNIGTRQNDRLRAGNVVDVPHDGEAITEAIRKALSGGKVNVKNPYGDGYSAKRIVDILEKVEVSVQKRYV